MKKLHTTSKILYIISILVISLPFMAIKGCHKGNKESEAVFNAKRDSIIKWDSILLVNTTANKLNADSLRADIKSNKTKMFNNVKTLDYESNSNYEWFTIHGYHIPSLTINAFKSFPYYGFSTLLLMLIFIDLVFILQLIGLILVFIKRFHRFKLIMILSFISLILCSASIVLAFINNDNIKISYGFWLLFFVLFLSAIINMMVHKVKE